MAMAAGKNKTHSRALFQHQRGSREKLSYPLSFDKTTGEQDQWPVIPTASLNCFASVGGIFDPITDNPYSIADPRTVFGNQSFFAARESHDEIGGRDKLGLGFPLAKALWRTLAQLILGTI